MAPRLRRRGGSCEGEAGSILELSLLFFLLFFSVVLPGGAQQALPALSLSPRRLALAAVAARRRARDREAGFVSGPTRGPPGIRSVPRLLRAEGWRQRVRRAGGVSAGAPRQRREGRKISAASFLLFPFSRCCRCSRSWCFWCSWCFCCAGFKVAVLCSKEPTIRTLIFLKKSSRSITEPLMRPPLSR